MMKAASRGEKPWSIIDRAASGRISMAMASEDQRHQREGEAIGLRNAARAHRRRGTWARTARRARSCSGAGMTVGCDLWPCRPDCGATVRINADGGRRGQGCRRPPRRNRPVPGRRRARAWISSRRNFIETRRAGRRPVRPAAITRWRRHDDGTAAAEGQQRTARDSALSLSRRRFRQVSVRRAESSGRSLMTRARTRRFRPDRAAAAERSAASPASRALMARTTASRPGGGGDLTVSAISGRSGRADGPDRLRRATAAIPRRFQEAADPEGPSRTGRRRSRSF